jgi:hypothetical protein
MHNTRKFSAGLGTTSERSSITIWPNGFPSAVTSKKHRGSFFSSAACQSALKTSQ